MKLQTLKPVAFLGSDATAIIHKLYHLEQRFLPLEVPVHSKLDRVIAGLEPLGFLGAIVVGNPSTELNTLVERKTHSAERAGAIDAVIVSSGSLGTNTLEDALINTLEATHYRGVGGHCVILGGGAVAFAATQLARCGFKTMTFAAPDRPAAEKLVRVVPAGVTTRALTFEEPSLIDALEKADLLVHCSSDVTLDARFLQPYHTLLEAHSETSLAVGLERAGGQIITYQHVAAHHLAAQLEFVTSTRFDAASLM
jgi:shikimate dehydrogenase